jgi:hypothetical protein
MWPPSKKCPERDERGVITVIAALSMVALLTVASLVTDLGLARAHRVADKGYADDAAVAGAHALDSGDQREMPFAGVCTALAYLKVNDPTFANPTGGWRDGNGTTIVGNPCATGSPHLTALCVPNTPSSWARYSGTGSGVTVEIKSGYVTPDPEFDAPGSGDNSQQGGCDQLAVIVTRTDHPTLGQIAHGGDIVTVTRSVARVIVTNSTSVVTGMLLLERHACNALQTTGSAQVHVLGNGAAGGAIQADSLGDSCTSGQKVISATSSTIIKAHKAESGAQPGTITTTALSGLPGAVPGNATSATANVCAEQVNATCGAAIGSPVVGRGPVDRRYLAGIQSALSTASGEYGKTSSFGSAVSGQLYTVLSCSQITSNNTAQAIFVNCPTGATIKSSTPVTFNNATDVVFNGPLTISNGGQLSMPKAARFFVKGVAGTGLSVVGSGYLWLNQGSNSGCNGYPTPTQAAQLVVGNGAFTMSNGAHIYLCGTTVLMADNTASSCPPPTTTSGTGMAPYDNSCGGDISLGGAAYTDWTAPNLYPSTSPPNWNGLEDLALWTETSAGNAITNGGSVQVTGVFYLPNANPFSITGAGSQSNGIDAEFIARRLVVQNSGMLYIRPNTVNTVPLPLPDSFQLVR